MNISLNWLTDYVDVSRVKASELAEVLTGVGLNVETVEEIDNDIVLDVEVTSNRPDCLGHLGVAREVAAALGLQFKPPVIDKLPTEGKVQQLAAVEVLEPRLCPRYTARVIRNVKIGPSPSWMVERLQAVGLRSINNVVDVTNYVLMEYSQPLHSFDYDKLASHKIVVRRAKAGEVMVSIDQTRCMLDESMLVIADAEKAVAIAGVMGGLNSEVTGSTTNILLESAQFDPLTIRRASRKLGLMSDSNYRFERGVDPVGLEEASRRACQLIVQLAGGQVADGIIDVWAEPYRTRQVALRPERCDKVLGMVIPPDRQLQILRNLQLAPQWENGKIVCTIPPYRSDLTREADLIEEVARHEGYNRIPLADKVTHTVVSEALPQRVRRQTGEILTASGFDECITSTFVDDEEAKLFGEPAPVHVDTIVRKTNNALRPTNLSSLLRVCKNNQDSGNLELSVFELANVFPPGGAGQLPRERTELAMVTTRDLQDLRGVLEVLLERIDRSAKLEVTEMQAGGFADGAAGKVKIDGQDVGIIGVLSQQVLSHYGLERPLTAATVNFQTLLDHAGKRRVYQPVAKFPAVRRDLSLVVDESVTWQQLSDVVAHVAQPLRAAMEYVTTYRGKQLPAGRKSVTVTLVYRSSEGTLRSEQVDQQVGEVVEAMKKNLSAELRA